MKRILLLILLLVIPLNNVMAEECSDKQLKEYESEASKIKLEAKQLDGTDTYKVFVSNLSNTRLGIEKGKTQFNDGPFDYVLKGSKFITNVYVADGSVCSGKVVRTISLQIGNNETIIEDIDNGIDSLNNRDSNKDNCDNCNKKIVEGDINPPIISKVEEYKEIIMEEDKNDDSYIDNRTEDELEEYKKELDKKIDEELNKTNENNKKERITVITSLILIIFTAFLLFFIGRKKNEKN